MIYLASIWVIPVIIAITFHEAAHGFVARLFGDETAWRLGRVSFNPLKHIDPVGTILLPGLLLLLHSPFLFGYAKPVPVNFRALRNPRRDVIWVAAAGPGRRDRRRSGVWRGSPTATITMGIVAVAAFAARLAGVAAATITSTLSRTRSASRPGSRSCWPSAHRGSSTMFWPST
jgi:Zn-dependent protease